MTSNMTLTEAAYFSQSGDIDPNERLRLLILGECLGASEIDYTIKLNCNVKMMHQASPFSP